MVFRNKFFFCITEYFLNWSDSALHYKKMFSEIKNGGNRPFFKVKCVQSQNIGHLESSLLP